MSKLVDVYVPLSLSSLSGLTATPDPVRLLPVKDTDDTVLPDGDIVTPVEEPKLSEDLLKNLSMMDIDYNDGSDVESIDLEPRDEPDIVENLTLPPKIHKTGTRTIAPDLANVNIPTVVKERADEIFGKMNIPIKRGMRRKKVIFFCVFSAYKELDLIFDPDELPKIMGIDLSKVSKALSMCSQSKTGYHPNHKRYYPKDLIPVYYKKTRMPIDNIKDVLDICGQIMLKDKDLYDVFPQTVAMAIVMYYMDIHGVKFDISIMGKIKSKTTLTSIRKRVEVVHNS